MGSPYRTPESVDQDEEEEEDEVDLTTCTCPLWVSAGEKRLFPHHISCPLGADMGSEKIAKAIVTWFGSSDRNEDNLAQAIAWALETHGHHFPGGSKERKEREDAVAQCIKISETLRDYWRGIGRNEAAEACTAIMACVRTFAAGG